MKPSTETHRDLPRDGSADGHVRPSAPSIPFSESDDSRSAGSTSRPARPRFRPPSSDPAKRRIFQIIRDKRAWEEPLTPEEAAFEREHDFKGWHTRGYLPHHDKPGTIQMITYRVGDAMPTALRSEWEALLAIEDSRERRTQIEAYLDKGRGACPLRDPRIASLVEENLLHFDGERYRLVAWVVMPNHLHILLELQTVPMGRIVKSWKAYTGAMANRLLGRAGPFWQEDYWDTRMRDAAHCARSRRYIERNPVMAGLARQPEEWPWSSANPRWRWTQGDSDESRSLAGARTVTSAPTGEEKGTG